MFSRKVVSKSLEAFSQLAGSFEPVPHSISQCDSMERHLGKLIEPWDGTRVPGLTLNCIYGKNGERQDWVSRRDPTKPWRKTLDAAEVQWIRNERAMCRYDFN